VSGQLKKPILALDVGQVRIGLAVSDPLHILAQPLMVLERKSISRDLDAIADVVREKDVGLIIVGLPITLSGGKSQSTLMAEDFAEKLSRKLPEHQIIFYDERLSTVQAKSFMIEGGVRRDKRKKKVDKVAAAVILQNYLDRQSGNGAPVPEPE